MATPYRVVIVLAEEDLAKRLLWQHALETLPSAVAQWLPDYAFLAHPWAIELVFHGVSSVADAITLANAEPHLLVINYDLEEADGALVVIEYIKHQELPICVICYSATAFDTKEKARLHQLVPADCLLRPFHPPQLLQMLAFINLRPIFDSLY